MTATIATISSITYASPDDGADAPCIFVWADGRTETHPKSWGGFFRGVVGGRDASGAEVEWRDGTGMSEGTTVAAAFIANGGSIAAYVPPAPPEEPAP
jgi:hypothetical protein